MAVYNDGLTLPILAGEALPAYRVVKVGVTSSTIIATLADSGDVPYGITGVAATDNADYAEVKALVPGRFIMTASEAIDIGEPVDLTTDGRIGDAVTGTAGVIGIALESSSGAGDEIAVLVNPLLFIGEAGS